MAGFITILAEALVGQFDTLYAVGSIAAAIPHVGTGTFAPVALSLLAAALIAAHRACRHGFPIFFAP